MTIYKPRALFQVDVPKNGNFANGYEELQPFVSDVKWSHNEYRVADELTVTVNYRDCGIDPRLLRNGRGALWLWDAAFEEFDKEKHLRFQGIVTKATRKGTDSGLMVDLTLQDYTNLFINMKPFPSDGYPDWNDTLETAWHKICDWTGWRDPANRKKIISSVTALREHLVVDSKIINKDLVIGKIVPERFHAISKPTYPNRADAWAIWQWLMHSLGLVSFIWQDKCIVRTVSEHNTPSTAAVMFWGENILSFEETVDAGITNKGIHLTSFNQLEGKVIEAFYPPPDDETIKKTRAEAKRILKGANAENETNIEYEPYERTDIQDQQTLEEVCRAVYESFKRQELNGTLTTHEMRVRTADGQSEVDLLSYSPGDAIVIGIDPIAYDTLQSLPDEDARAEYLISIDYPEATARAIASNFTELPVFNTVFHIESVEITLSQDKYEAEIKFHNILMSDAFNKNVPMDGTPGATQQPVRVINVPGYDDNVINAAGWDDSTINSVGWDDADPNRNEAGY